VITFGRDVCGDLAAVERREWLVTNGIGGYAMGTIAGTLTRRYHGLLVAALKPPLGRTLLVTKLDETATYAGLDYPLFANRWISGEVEPAGFHHLERFHLEGTTPVWTFAWAEALLEKRVWMEPDENTAYVQYQLRRGAAPLVLTAKALVNYRDYHSRTHAAGWQMQIAQASHGLQATAFDGATPFFLLSDRAEATPAHEWYSDFFLSIEAYRGLDAAEDHLYAGLLRVTLQPGESVTIVASTTSTPNLDGDSAYTKRRQYEQARLYESAHLTEQPIEPTNQPSSERTHQWLQQLVLAADQFIVRRPLPGDPDGHSIIAGYPWFGDWGRDTMISLPGLALATGRTDIAARILRTFAHFVDQGMLPNRFPDAGETPEYNTVDATLWYFEAIRAYHAAILRQALPMASGPVRSVESKQGAAADELLHELFTVLEEIITWHQQGTRYNIHVDPVDGLLYAGRAGVQLTWMDAKVGDWVVTPRIGKPVEINALWYNALRIMAVLAHHLGKPAETYQAAAERARDGFARFWNPAAGYCYDVLDGPDGNDPALRPNQLFAVSLPHSPLTSQQQRAVVDACARHLVTSHGLRSLAPDHPAYSGHYGGDQRQRDGAYHQGTVWSWLIGPFVRAHLRVYGDPDLARSYLHPLMQHLADHGVGTISEVFDGDPPFTPRGCVAQAWGVAELLRAWQTTAEYTKER
jgi:glycogen debranching enzyme